MGYSLNECQSYRSALGADGRALLQNCDAPHGAKETTTILHPCVIFSRTKHFRVGIKKSEVPNHYRGCLVLGFLVYVEYGRIIA